MKRTLENIRTLVESIKEDSKDIPDDFDYWLIKDLETFVGKTLYMLTRGEEGIKNALKLEVL